MAIRNPDKATPGLPLVVATALLSSACTQAIDLEEEVDEASGALVSDNGVSMQGVSMQGVSMQGVSMQGVSMQGVSMQGVSMQGVSMQGVSMQGASFAGVMGNGTAATVMDFIGSSMTAALSNGDSVSLHIDDIEPTADPAMYLVTVSYYDGAEWRSLCGDVNGVPIKAIPLSGRWDTSQGTATGGSYIDEPGTFTFACRGAVLAKCVEMGYKPWKTVTECKKPGQCVQRPLRHWHQACTRMMRADYCGDGMPHTKTGNLINLWDNLSIQARGTVSSDWKLEAEWQSTGALCVKDLRRNVNNETSNYIAAHCPERLSPVGFSCFGDTSTFFTPYGFTTPLPSRSLLRNEADYYGNLINQ